MSNGAKVGLEYVFKGLMLAITFVLAGFFLDDRIAAHTEKLSMETKELTREVHVMGNKVAKLEAQIDGKNMPCPLTGVKK